MPGVHKNPTIIFRISDYERREIEAKIKASGMRKKEYLLIMTFVPMPKASSISAISQCVNADVLKKGAGANEGYRAKDSSLLCK